MTTVAAVEGGHRAMDRVDRTIRGTHAVVPVRAASSSASELLYECYQITAFPHSSLCSTTCPSKHCYSGLEEKGLQNILRAAGKKSNILTVNGMELAALRAEGSDVLDLSG